MQTYYIQPMSSRDEMSCKSLGCTLVRSVPTISTYPPIKLSRPFFLATAKQILDMRAGKISYHKFEMQRNGTLKHVSTFHTWQQSEVEQPSTHHVLTRDEYIAQGYTD